MNRNIQQQEFELKPKDRIKFYGHNPLVIWLTGYSGSGKSTIANALEILLYSKKVRTYVLDGDNIRMGVCSDLSFSDADRKENIRRVGEIAALMMDAGLVVITSFISPFYEDRAIAKRTVGEINFIEVFINTPIHTCEHRDPKGLYKKVRNGEIMSFTGINSPYEEPINPDIEIKTEEMEVEDAVNFIWNKIQDKIVLNEN